MCVTKQCVFSYEKGMCASLPDSPAVYSMIEHKLLVLKSQREHTKEFS